MALQEFRIWRLGVARADRDVLVQLAHPRIVESETPLDRQAARFAPPAAAHHIELDHLDQQIVIIGMLIDELKRAGRNRHAVLQRD